VNAIRNPSPDFNSSPPARSFRAQFTLRALLATILAINILLGVSHPWIQMALRSHSGRLWQPSSQHNGGIVNCCDDRGNYNIDPNVYLWIVTRAGGEPLPATY
jgi:hypothetical protein